KQLFPSPLSEKMLDLAKNETDAEVRSQLASTAKRLPGDQAIPLIHALLTHPDDAKDPHIPLLLWWAAEAHLDSHRDALVALFADRATWSSPVARDTIAPRVARGLATSVAEVENQKALVTLLDRAPGDAERKLLLAGVAQAFEGRQIPPLIPEL